MNKEESWAAAFFAVAVVIFFVWLEVVLVQWLLGLFGYHFGWWTTLGIIFVIDLVFGRIRFSVKKR